MLHSDEHHTLCLTKERRNEGPCHPLPCDFLSSEIQSVHLLLNSPKRAHRWLILPHCSSRKALGLIHDLPHVFDGHCHFYGVLPCATESSPVLHLQYMNIVGVTQEEDKHVQTICPFYCPTPTGNYSTKIATSGAFIGVQALTDFGLEGFDGHGIRQVRQDVADRKLLETEFVQSRPLFGETKVTVTSGQTWLVAIRVPNDMRESLT